MNAPRNLAVGDVLVCSWGYDQTNVNYYQVTALIGKTMVEIRPIDSEKVEDLPMQGWCTPKVSHFISAPPSLPEPIRRKAKGTSVCITQSQYADLLSPIGEVDGEKVYERQRWTAYA